MGMDFLDFSFRTEKSFGIKITGGDFDELLRHCRIPTDVTAGELHDWLVELCREQGVPVPPSSWHRVKLILAKTVSITPRRISRDTLARKDLGME